jgi:uncharacterized membrane protein
MSHAMVWGEKPTEDDKMWAAVAHVSPFIAPLMGPIIVLLIFNEKGKYIRYHAIQAIVMQIVLGVVGVISAIVIAIISALTCGVGAVLYLLMFPLALVPLYGAWQAWNGTWSGFPLIDSVGR